MRIITPGELELLRFIRERSRLSTEEWAASKMPATEAQLGILRALVDRGLVFMVWVRGVEWSRPVLHPDGERAIRICDLAQGLG